MADRRIPQRELRNNIGAILRAAEAGETFTVTVRGRPVARLGPAEGPREDVDRETLRRILTTPIDADLARELDEAEAPVGDPGPRRERSPARHERADRRR